LLAELTDVLSADVHPGEQMYTYLTSALRGLVQHPDPAKVALVMSWKLLTQAGLAPRVSRCQQCGQQSNKTFNKTSNETLPAVYLDVAAGEVLCEACQQGQGVGVQLEPADYLTLSTILQCTTREALENPLVTSLFQWSLLARYVSYHAHTLDSMPIILGLAATTPVTPVTTHQETPCSDC
jgi:recombinational DNA repair protein (RecF pathway)